MVLALLEARGQPPPRPPGRDVRRGRAAVAALRAGLRLPRGRPRVGLRPRPPGDDRRRLVDARRSPPRCGRCSRAGTTCSPRWPPRRRSASAGSVRSRRAEVATLIGCAFIGAEALLLLGFDRHQLPVRASLRRFGQLIRAAEERRRHGARQPDDRGPRRARRVGAALGALRRRRADDRCCCRRGRSSRRGTGRCRSRTSPAGTASSRSTGAATAAPIARRRRRLHASTSSPPTPLAVLDATGTERAVLVGAVVRRVVGRHSSPPTIPTACSGSSPSARRCRWRHRSPSGSVHPFDEPHDDDRRLGEVQRPLLAARLRGLPRVLLRPDVPRAALDEAARGLRRLGAGDRRRDADRHRRTASTRGLERLPLRSARVCAARCS